jgi:hypothetical protein
LTRKKSLTSAYIYSLKEYQNSSITSSKSLAKIAPCFFGEGGDINHIDAIFVRLDPTHGFMLEKWSLQDKRSDSSFGKNAQDDDHVWVKYLRQDYDSLSRKEVLEAKFQTKMVMWTI